MRNTGITIILVIILIINGSNVLVDVSPGALVWHILQETSLVILFAIDTTVLIFRRRFKLNSFNLPLNRSSLCY